MASIANVLKMEAYARTSVHRALKRIELDDRAIIKYAAYKCACVMIYRWLIEHKINRQHEQNSIESLIMFHDFPELSHFYRGMNKKKTRFCHCQCDEVVQSWQYKFAFSLEWVQFSFYYIHFQLLFFIFIPSHSQFVMQTLLCKEVGF